mmetsp:Transcript_30811/g.30325  ORF Transcript_30811/g.30325 Transcript_30811/m.30325 type:complete len:100 (-) Transcript_30811:456-755(-)
MLVGEMQVPRHSHGLCFLDNEVYILGGVTPKEYATAKCERFNVVSRTWQNLPGCKFNRISPKLCASFNSKLIYVFGGVPENSDANTKVEVLDTSNMEWK